MATYFERKKITLQQLLDQNKYCKPDAVFCNGNPSNEKDCLNNPVDYWTCNSGIIYMYTVVEK